MQILNKRTMFVVPVELAPVVQEACTRAVAEVERRKLVRFLDEAGIAKDPGRWLREVEAEAMAALAARGEALAAELGTDVPRLRRQLVLGEGTRWALRQSVSTRVLFLLAADGQDRARPPARLVDEQPVSMGAGRVVAARWDNEVDRGGSGQNWPAGGWPRSAPARPPT